MKTNKAKFYAAALAQVLKSMINFIVDKSVSLWAHGLSLLRFNIAFKLSLGYAFHVAWLLIIVTVSVNLAFNYYLVEEVKQDLNDDQTFFASVIQQPSDLTLETFKAYVNHRKIQYAFYNQQGVTVLSSTGSAFPSQASLQKPMSVSDLPFIGQYLAKEPLLNMSWDPAVINHLPMYSSRKIDFADDTSVELVIQDQRLASLKLREVMWLVTSLIALILTLSSSRDMSRKVKKQLRPIHLMTDQVRDISANNLDTRLNVSGTKDELKDLALTFNQMLEAIQQHYVREKQFVSDVSHELRTPIAVIKGYGNLLNRWGKTDVDVLEESIQAITSEADYMQKMVEDLLFIARNEAGQMATELTQVNLSQLMADVERETRLIHESLKMTVQIEPGVVIQGSYEKMKQAIRIFVDNSCKYSPEGGSLTLTVRRTAKNAIIVIQDQGIGIAPEDMPHIFERFYRADKSRTRESGNRSDGVGLGLSIAALIIQQHHGNIHPESKLGEGTTMSILLPLIKD